jgi:hypothetical protein
MFPYTHGTLYSFSPQTNGTTSGTPVRRLKRAPGTRESQNILKAARRGESYSPSSSIDSSSYPETPCSIVSEPFTTVRRSRSTSSSRSGEPIRKKQKSSKADTESNVDFDEDIVYVSPPDHLKVEKILAINKASANGYRAYVMLHDGNVVFCKASDMMRTHFKDIHTFLQSKSFEQHHPIRKRILTNMVAYVQHFERFQNTSK